MAEKLKIIPLGGLDEIGKNITVLEYGKDMIVVDCGLGFPDEDMYGVDLVIPDFTYLVQNQKKLRGMFCKGTGCTFRISRHTVYSITFQ